MTNLREHPDFIRSKELCDEVLKILDSMPQPVDLTVLMSYTQFRSTVTSLSALVEASLVAIEHDPKNQELKDRFFNQLTELTQIVQDKLTIIKRVDEYFKTGAGNLAWLRLHGFAVKKVK